MNLNFAIILFCITALLVFHGNGQTAAPVGGTALLIIDIQNDYFDGGRMPLVGSVEASLQAKKLLETFREHKMVVVHVHHVSLKPGTPPPKVLLKGQEIHPNVAPWPGEKIIQKHYVNSFRETDLLDYLKKNRIRRLVVCGMMTNMCLEAAVRAAVDLGYECTVVHDACATRDYKFGGREVPAIDVHAAALAAIQFGYARVVSTTEAMFELKAGS